MFEFLGKTVAKIFGSKSERDLKEIVPYVALINAEYAKLAGLTDDQLRAQTDAVRARIAERLAGLDGQIAGLHQQIDTQLQLDVAQKEVLFEQIDALEKQRNKDLEAVLLEVLPLTFAIVKDTARRYKENGQIVVTANAHDREYATTHPNCVIEGDKAIWANKWTAAGAEITWDMVHYDVQLIGGVVLHQGKISEMATGEGKTLVSTLPSFLNALSKRGVHLVTVNDYLAKRDSEWNAPLFEVHGITVDCIDKHQPNTPERRKAYQADITYGTNNEFGFDYLRDNMARDPEELVQRKHHYAMVDEVDSVLIDDARTPLIISGPVPRGDVHEFYQLKPRIQRLVDEQKKLVQNYLVQARKAIAEGKTGVEEADKNGTGGLMLFRAYRGLPKSKPLIKFLSETGIRQVLQATENHYLADNSRQMPKADEPLFFTIDEKNNQIELTEKGIDLITAQGEDPKLFIMPDIGMAIADIEKNNALSAEEKLQQKDKLMSDYNEKSERVHTVNQLLKAYTLFEKDDQYILTEDGKVKIVDEQTGRVMEGRRYSDGLHQAIEAKENVRVEDATQTYATVTLQNYFRMYHKLGGMTGTAETEAGEFWEIYKLDVVVIPTNRGIARKDADDQVYKTVREKYNAVAQEIQKLVEAGRPVLVGTTSVEISELVSRMLKLRGIQHQVLNAKQNQREAEIVAAAGYPGTVTIATNMAGRGTDIKLRETSREAGGLAIIGTERHESRRVDRQLRGRAGRQGDPGTSQFFVSLEDNLMRLFGSDRIAKLMDRMGMEEGEVIQHSMITNSIERAQKKVEENNFGTRKRLLEYDDVMNAQREVVYKRRRNALHGDRMEVDILNMIYDVSEDIASGHKITGDFEDFKLNIIKVFGYDTYLTAQDLTSLQVPALTQKLYDEALGYFQSKNEHIASNSLPLVNDLLSNGSPYENIAVPFTDGKKQVQAIANLRRAQATGGHDILRQMEKVVVLSVIDTAWTQHLRQMDDLKQVVQNAVYEQKDPLLVYKFESFELFKRMIGKVNEETTTFLFHADVPVNTSMVGTNEEQDYYLEDEEQQTNFTVEHESSLDSLGAGPEDIGPDYQSPQVAEKQMPVRSQKVANRNDKVNVQYMDGRVVRDVKYKSVEQDVESGRAVLVD
ncbi:preprotein translocase subunit SecA [Hymenobacter negativus]|uniref:Protein translocase subunit SecA n=1 Tax=Hymenobacter negativus TaxID=2795026 RepID=A0ABS0QA49_9BACT|nr:MULTISPECIES: preprotein translocase subunit SecA [Bacteria]MBH8559500.1 preprotein translocase subunit SecA [Hymenobacter negativus]MBH8568432.1 preprotein translocase subunit SecA [Hymenobacter negativus]MBR7208167.1 preprotein translocase subunit SecA [Microvirga sp. STS02]